MLFVYSLLITVHILAIVVTGILWVIVDIHPTSTLRKTLRDIRAVHFGSLYLVPWFLGLAWAFDRFHVPFPHWVFFPAGLGALVLFSGIGYLFPRPADLDPFYYWTRGVPFVLAMIGLAFLAFGLLWTAGALCVYAW